MADTRWLEKRYQGWYAVKDVPRPLRSLVGRKRFIKSLGTRDLHVAVARRHAALAEFGRIIAAAQSRSTVDPIVEAGIAWRDTFASIDRGDPAVADHLGGLDEAEGTASLVFYGEIDRIRDEKGHTAAKAFHDLARGLATPLLHFVDAWLIEGGIKGPLRERTQRRYRSDLVELAAWTTEAGIPPTIEAITKQAASRYVTEALLGNGIDRKTANRKISAASAYWRWLVKRTPVSINPWTGQSLVKVSINSSGTRAKRPFTEAEVVALLSGPADPELADLMPMAALTGMRIEEIYRLTAADCAGGWFNVRVAKTRAGMRRVPIHSALGGIVSRRTTGKPPTAYLFPEAGPVRPGRERSMAVSKRFGHYRQRLGVEERADGRRQSRIDFHSWRRWFITHAREAGFDRAIVAAIVGQEVGNITDDLYSGGPSDARKRDCVEAVKLPPFGAISAPSGVPRAPPANPRTAAEALPVEGSR